MTKSTTNINRQPLPLHPVYTTPATLLILLHISFYAPLPATLTSPDRSLAVETTSWFGDSIFKPSRADLATSTPRRDCLGILMLDSEPGILLLACTIQQVSTTLLTVKSSFLSSTVG